LETFGAKVLAHARGREDRAHLRHFQFVVGFSDMADGSLFRRFAQEFDPVPHEHSFPQLRQSACDRGRARLPGG